MSKLSAQDLRRIEDEERYRDKIRTELLITKKKRKGDFIRIALTIFVILAVIGGITSSSSNNVDADKNVNTEKKLRGKVTVSTVGLVIQNIDSVDWQYCSFQINQEWKYPAPATSSWVRDPSIEVISANEVVKIPFGEFSKRDGSRFNVYVYKPTTLSVLCHSGIGIWQL